MRPKPRSLACLGFPVIRGESQARQFEGGKLGSSYYGSLPASDQIILTRCSKTTALFAAAIVASVEAIGVSGPELGLLNPLGIVCSYTCRTVPVGNVQLGCVRTTPLYTAQKTLVFEHHSSTPEPDSFAKTRIAPRAYPMRCSQ
jgi:hypothetical protein